MDKQQIAKLKSEGFLAQQQQGYFSVRVVTNVGNMDSRNMAKLSEIAEKYGRGYMGFTTRLCVEIPWIKEEDIDNVKQELKDAGMRHGGTGKRVRPIVPCKGTVCTHGIIDTQGICMKLHEKYFAMELPAKLKIGAVGCPNNCAKASLNDIGFMGQAYVKIDREKCKNCKLCVGACKTKAIEYVENKTEINREKCLNCLVCSKTCPFGAITVETAGVALFIGGRFGRQWQIGRRVDRIFKVYEIEEVTGKIIDYFKENAKDGERLALMIERIGWDKVQKDLFG